MNAQIAAQNTMALGNISELYPRYLAYLDTSKKTIETYMRALKQFAKYLQENNIVSPQREDIINYRDSLAERLKANTVQIYIVAVRLFFRWLAQENIYPDIANHIKGAKVSREHKKDYLNARQIQSIIPVFDQETITGRRDYALFSLMVTGGLRDIEAHRANIEDLRTLGDSTVIYLQGKGKEDKAIYVKIPAPVEKALRAMLADRPSAKGTDPLFISYSNNSKGARMSTRSISGIIKHAFIQSGYNSDRLTAHSLRHTAVTLSLLGGNTLEETQSFARHTNIATTQIYSHAIERAQSKCESTIASAIWGKEV